MYLFDQGVHLLLTLATALATVLLAVEKLARVAKDNLSGSKMDDYESVRRRGVGLGFRFALSWNKAKAT